MNQIITTQLPLIVAEEKTAMLTSILNLLRQKGYVVFLQEQGVSESAGREVMVLDALSILRFVCDNWPQSEPVLIQQAMLCQQTPTKRVAA